MSELGLVWFKRDLRVSDHQPLAEACARGRVILLYIYEPEIIEAPDFAARHLAFINDSLQALDEALRALGASLIRRVGRAEEVLAELHKETGFQALYSHEETGNAVTYARDKRVAAWARSVGVTWTEHRQFGVFRALRERDGWAARWNSMMATPLTPAPKRVDALALPGLIGTMPTKEVSIASPTDALQRGGSREAQALLRSFLTERGANYQSEMSSPLTAPSACSRLSPHLAYGTISMKSVHQAVKLRRQALRQAPRGRPSDGSAWAKAMASFDKRLHWHCHFMQKLESEPRIEFENMASSHDGLREEEFNREHFEAWCAGQTGYPMVDACMRSLNATGWLSFRMRAMVVSFASYHLWLHWRPTALYLARVFLDYEPGIHYSQVQMQSGTTGINAVRIYSPIKQVKDHDPKGTFIRRWVPELDGVPDEHIAEPHRMSRDAQKRSGLWIGESYPEPLVDHLSAVREARTRIYARRRAPEAKEEAQRINKKHGSRRRSERARRRARP